MSANVCASKRRRMYSQTSSPPIRTVTRSTCSTFGSPQNLQDEINLPFGSVRDDETAFKRPTIWWLA